MSKSRDVFCYQSVCELIGEALNRVLQHNFVYAAVHNVLRDFDNEALNDKLIDAPLFHGEKIYSVSNIRKNIVEMKIIEPCSICLWKGKFNFSVGRKENMVFEIQVYPGDKIPSTSVKDSAQYLHYKVRDDQKNSHCTDTVDVTEN